MAVTHTARVPRNLKLVTVAVACAAGAVLAAGFTVSSPAFQNGARIPARYTCDGAGVSFPLAFGTPPAGTKSFAILGWDDSMKGLRNQWAAFDLPVTTTTLPEGVPNGATALKFKQGKNSSGAMGWSAICPAKGERGHEYYIDFYALNVATLGLPPGADWTAVHAAIKRHKIVEAKLMGVYAR
jgi:hypothetical protein